MADIENIFKPVPDKPPIIKGKKEGSLSSIFLGVFLGIVLILILFGLVNYFGIVPFSEFFPNQLGWLPTKTGTNEQGFSASPTPAQPTPTESLRLKPSEVAGIMPLACPVERKLCNTGGNLGRNHITLDKYDI